MKKRNLGVIGGLCEPAMIFPAIYHVMPIMHHENRIPIIITPSVTKDEINEKKFEKHLLDKKYIITLDTPKKGIFEVLGIQTYADFKTQYDLIQQKKSKLSSKDRKELTNIWVDLFEV